MIADTSAEALTVSALGVAVRVAGVADLIASKLSRRRDKDLKALPELERLRELVRARDAG